MLYVFTDRSTQPTTSGGNIFRCTTKDIEERRVKGTAVPFNPLGVNADMRGDVRRSYVFAEVQFTRLRPARRRAPVGSALVVPSALAFEWLTPKSKRFLSCKALALLQTLFPPDSCVLRPDGDALASPEEVPLGYTALRRIRNTFRITSVVQTRQLVGCVELDFQPSLRTSAHTGVAIRIPLWYAQLICMTFRRTDCHTPTEVPLGEDGRHKVRPAWGQHEPLGN